MKRLMSCTSSEMLKMNREELLQSIKASEGRVILSENVATVTPTISDCTNSELARAFGADLILLNLVDVLNLKLSGIEVETNVIKELKRLVGRPIGVNLEPIDTKAEMLENRADIARGRTLNEDTAKALKEHGFDFVCLTGNPGTGVSINAILEAIKLTRKHFDGIIIAGKMHGAGTKESIYDEDYIGKFIEAGADVILIPSPGTVPGSTLEKCERIVKFVKEKGKLTMGTIGTSQETSDVQTVRQIALWNKMVGFDIHHIGDAGYGGLAIVENIYELSKVVRGLRQTLKAMGSSINR